LTAESGEPKRVPSEGLNTWLRDGPELGIRAVRFDGRGRREYGRVSVVGRGSRGTAYDRKAGISRGSVELFFTVLEVIESRGFAWFTTDRSPIA
jgi:hypothetical protein